LTFPQAVRDEGGTFGAESCECQERGDINAERETPTAPAALFDSAEFRDCSIWSRAIRFTDDANKEEGMPDVR